MEIRKRCADAAVVSRIIADGVHFRRDIVRIFTKIKIEKVLENIIIGRKRNVIGVNA